MSLILRHNPQEYGVKISADGWVKINDLIEVSDGLLTKEVLKKVIETSDKRRFELSDDANFVRANQGHSIEVDLGLQARTPPNTLYHGTATKFIEQIEVEGLKPKARQFVHLSLGYETAEAVGSRHGKPVVLTVDSQKMHKAGYKFFISANGVWLTKIVPPSFLRGF